jgi:hypothetical protein
MATWISHLRIAEKLLAEIPGLDEVAFAFGNLAADSGKPNEDWTQFDPPKEVTHFLRSGQGARSVRDLEFYNLYLKNLGKDDLACYSFTLGYYIHLVCDSLWSHWIVAATMRDFVALLAESRREFWSQVKGDWYSLDQRYAQAHPESLFWRAILPNPNPPLYLPFLSPEGLEYSLDYIRQFYSQPEPQWLVERPYPFLNAGTLSRYVNDSVAVLLEIYADFERLADLQDAPTALDLIDAQRLEAFPAPLGDVTVPPSTI